MNLVELLSQELKDKHFTEFEKVRYIYIRCCQIFSFDTKWHYLSLFKDKDLKNKLANKRFDIENIDEYLVVCHTFSKYILKPLIEELTNLKVDLEEGEHTILTLSYGPHIWELDATLGDLTRVKAKLKTNGFTGDFPNSDIVVDDIDKTIGYIRHNKDYFINRINGNNDTERTESIGRLLASSDCKYHYADASFYYSFLAFAVVPSQHDLTYIGDDYKFNKLIKLENDDTYFNLYRKKTVYSLNQIDKEEYNTLKRTLKHE